MSSVMKKVKGCDSTASKLSMLCYIYIILLVLLWIKVMRVTIDMIKITKTDAEVKKGVIIEFFLYTLLVFTPQLFIVYKMCRYKRKWLYFILYVLLLFIVFEIIIKSIYVKIIIQTFPKLSLYNASNGTNKKYEIINFDNEKYIETILEESDEAKSIILYSYDDLKTVLFSAIFTKLHTSSNFVSDENYIVVANIEGKLQVFDKKTNEEYTYDETSNCNAVAIGYYDYTFDEDFNKFGYNFKKDDIYKEDVLVYNNGSRLYARSPVIRESGNTPFKRYYFLDFTAKIDRITITYEKDNDFLISVFSKDKLTSVKRNKDGRLTLKT